MTKEVYSEENYKKMKKLLKERVSKKRFEHCKRVSKTAVQLAEMYGVDPDKARFAGLLHDWDKGLSLEMVRDRVAEFGIDIDPVVVSDMPYLLHGPTAAAALAAEFPEIDADVIQSIARHTSGARNMTPLDMVVYIADLLEPERTYAHVEEIRRSAGKVSLYELYFLAFKNIYMFLVSQNRLLHPQTVEVWNSLVHRLKMNGPHSVQAAYGANSQLEAQPGDWMASERRIAETMRSNG